MSTMQLQIGIFTLMTTLTLAAPTYLVVQLLNAQGYQPKIRGVKVHQKHSRLSASNLALDTFCLLTTKPLL